MSQAPSTDQPTAKALPGPPVPRPSVSLAKIDVLLVASFLALTFLLGVFPLKDTDFWWHLKEGDQIRQTWQVPKVDTFTYGAEGHAWTDLHWGFQVALSWGYQQGGVVFLNVAKCVITCVALFLLITSRKRDWPLWVMLLTWLPALLVLSGRMYIRPETFSLLYLSMVLAILFRWDRQPWLAFALPVVQLFWVNSHGLFILEPIVIVFALIDEVVRPGSFAVERRGWWKKILAATVLTGLACLCNPYGLAGAIYPLQLFETMQNPIFRETILELEPVASFIKKVGFDNLLMKLYFVTFALGGLSFLLPIVWGATVGLVDLARGTTPVPAELPKGKRKRETAKAKKGKKAATDQYEGLAVWSPFVFRGLLFACFGWLSLSATRNSHQFAAVVGTVTAWNFGEWLGMVRARRLKLDPSATRVRAWPGLLTLATILAVFFAVASGRFYAWAGEGRTIGLGEEPLWFPKAAVKFAGGPGMPDKLVAFHNGHASLYEYAFAPDKKVYTDARLEVMGPEVYTAYINLSKSLSNNKGPGDKVVNWAEELDKMGRPAILVDNIQIGSAALSATLLNSLHWRCVYYDALAAVFVHESLTKVVQEHSVDFLARHYQREADLALGDPAALAAMARSLRLLGTDCLQRGDRTRTLGLFLLGLDYTRREREVDPQSLDGWKNAGLIHVVPEIVSFKDPIPRFRLPFDPVIDLGLARGTYGLRKALEIDPDEGIVQYYLALAYQIRGMAEQALPLLEKYAYQPNKNLTMQGEKTKAAQEAAVLRSKLGRLPNTRWNNRSELEPMVAELLNSGRVSTAADVMESAYRPESRPWEWADRLAVLRLHLGEPDKARAAWQAASIEVPAATRLARVAVTYLVEGDFSLARKTFQQAIAADPRSFEAHYGLAVLEQDAGLAEEALLEARLAEKLATSENARNAARAIATSAAAYAKKP